MARSLLLPVAALLLLALAVSAYPDTTDGEDNGVPLTVTSEEPVKEYTEDKPVVTTYEGGDKPYSKYYEALKESYTSYKSSPKSYKGTPYGGYGYTPVSRCVW